ncbi:MAG: M1 family metallopeptidase [Gemmatimonadota bacterium]
MRSAVAITAIAVIGAAGQAAAQNNSSRPGLDVLGYVFEVDFPARPLEQPISLRSTALVLRSARADTLILDLAAAMQLGRVMVNGVAAAVVRESSAVRINLPAGTNDTLRVELDYRGQPRDGLIIRRDSTGFWTAFADHFPNRARQWLATVDHPSDKAAVEWVVRTPATHRVIANGDLLEETPQLDSSGTPVRLLTRWRSLKPLYTAVMVIGVAPFAVYDLGETACGLAERPGCVEQSVWITPDVRPSMPGPFARAGEMVALFSRLVGPYPYEKLAHVQSSTRYGGMENASAIFYADRIYRRGTMSEGLIAHEAAHQWFGDAVTTREWPHVWLSEGFATYFAALWSEHSRGDSAFLADMRRMRDGVLRDEMAATHPVIHASLTDAANVLNGLVYGKAGFVLHMLRREVGDSAFFRGIRSYYTRYRHGNALTADFQREIEASAAVQLGWFFDQWLRRPGLAEITTSWQWDGVRRAIDLTVTQGGRFPPFQLTLPVDVTDSSGRVHRIRVKIPASRVTTIPIPVPIDGQPRSVAFDVDVSILGTVRPASP